MRPDEAGGARIEPVTVEQNPSAPALQVAAEAATVTANEAV